MEKDIINDLRIQINEYTNQQINMLFQHGGQSGLQKHHRQTCNDYIEHR